MKVELINYTQDADELLLTTKNTRRLDHKDTSKISEEQKKADLDYTFKTISGPWEFVDYTFLISGVTRAFTHQLVRHRVGTSFAQESMRIVDASDFEWAWTGEGEAPAHYEIGMLDARRAYSQMLLDGVPIQDARGVVPTNICTKICMKINLRALSSMMEKRLCVRTAGEFQQVAKELRRLVIEAHSWAKPALYPACLRYGSCCFPAFEECPIKKAHPHLQPDDHECDRFKTVESSWEDAIGMSIQPS